ncbi:hypothetical protein DFH09DRAFT_1142868 [Mycena vulgaris]|nr:hypothetical protein DFH09DRAFT_1142868 [Mycena vulgaris]
MAFLLNFLHPAKDFCSASRRTGPFSSISSTARACVFRHTRLHTSLSSLSSHFASRFLALLAFSLFSAPSVSVSVSISVSVLVLVSVSVSVSVSFSFGVSVSLRR